MKWININDKTPKHGDVILVSNSIGGQAVCIFLETKEMNKIFKKHGITSFEDEKKVPYHFSSQEVKGAELNNVQYWMPLPESPK